jgi:ER-bound oxygenase mpaB/B'/Rubber oxygenase, catalytic domain
MQSWTGDFLDSMRQLGDPLADNAVGQLFASGDVKAVNALMKTLVENDQPPPETLPPVIREYLATSEGLPAWADPVKIKAGEDFFWRFGPEAIMNLFCYSLPFCYAARKGVQVLALTSRLYTNPTRRIIETAQMMVDVLRPGGLSPGGTGVRTAQKVRLMHAGVRHQTAAYPGWNPEFGKPINQEDLAGTLLSFGWVVIDGLRKLELRIDDTQAEAYLHCWNVVGHILGVREDLLPANMAAAEQLAHIIQQRQYASCEEGRDMTRALIQMMQRFLPGTLLDPIPALFTRFLLGNAYSDLLGVEAIPDPHLLMLPLRAFNVTVENAKNSSAIASAISNHFSRRVIEGILLVGRGGNRIPFDIPTELRQTWGVNWTARGDTV